MIVYVVTSGRYSDFGIEAMFSTRELANTYIQRRREHSEIHSYPDFNDIAEYELDSMDSDWMAGRIKCWRVWIEIATANVIRVEMNSDNPIDDTKAPALYPKQVTLVIDVLADTQEHAVKIAMERRSVWLANIGTT